MKHFFALVTLILALNSAWAQTPVDTIPHPNGAYNIEVCSDTLNNEYYGVIIEGKKGLEELVIPATFDTENDSYGIIPIREIGTNIFWTPFFAPNTTLKNIDFSGASNLIKIGKYAFAHALELKSVDLSALSSLTTIGKGAFFACKALKKVNFSGLNSLSSIGDYAFTDCIKLPDVNFKDLPKLSSIGDKAFRGCDALTKVDLSGHKNISSIGLGAFEYCDQLSKVDFTDASKLSRIDKFAFASCPKLKPSKVVFNNTVPLVYVGELTFDEIDWEDGNAVSLPNQGAYTPWTPNAFISGSDLGSVYRRELVK